MTSTISTEPGTITVITWFPGGTDPGYDVVISSRRTFQTKEWFSVAEEAKQPVLDKLSEPSSIDGAKVTKAKRAGMTATTHDEYQALLKDYLSELMAASDSGERPPWNQMSIEFELWKRDAGEARNEALTRREEDGSTSAKKGKWRDRLPRMFRPREPTLGETLRSHLVPSYSPHRHGSQ